MKLPQMKLNKEVSKPRLTLKVTDRDKKLLAGFAALLIIILSYFVLYKPMSAKTAALKSEREKVDNQVAVAKSDIANEDSINQAYETELDSTNKSTSMFFPKVYPYKDRYVLLMEKAVADGGAKVAKVEFSDPEAGHVLLTKEDKRFVLPGYPLLDLAKKINRAYPQGNETNNDSVIAKKTTAEKSKADKTKTLAADSVLRLPVTLEIKGSYSQIRTTLKNLEDLKRAMIPKNVSIRKDKSGSIDATLEIDFYAVEKVDNKADSFNVWTIQGSYGKADPFN